MIEMREAPYYDRYSAALPEVISSDSVEASFGSATRMMEMEPDFATPPKLVTPAPSLDGPTSTDGTEDYLQFMAEVPANATSTSEQHQPATSWPSDDGEYYPAMMDASDEEFIDGQSYCSSGILSSETIDFEMLLQESKESPHSLASMKTLKSPIGRIPAIAVKRSVPVYDDSVDAEEVPKNNGACHGSLGIDPKQLAEVFALFKSQSRTAKRSSPPQAGDSQKKQPLQNATATPPTHPSTPSSLPSTSSPPTSNDYHVMTRADRFKAACATDHRLTSELYWKPRAKNLEKECQTLKDILHADSTKILHLQGSLETLREERLKSASEIKSFQEELDATRQELDSLKKERDMLFEHGIEYQETIKILKNEVDILTSSGKAETATKAKDPPAVDLQELRQLRLENQLFASQIIEYEAEVESLMQEVDLTRQYVKVLNEALPPVKPSDSLQFDDPRIFLPEISSEDQCDLLIAQNQESSASPAPKRKLAMLEGGVKKRTGNPGRIGSGNGGGEEEKQASIQGDAQFCLERIASEMPDASSKLGTVLGMFTVRSEEKDANDDIFVVQEPHQRESEEGEYGIKCMQWLSPDAPPTLVKVGDVAQPHHVEDRNPPVTSSLENALSDKTNVIGIESLQVLKKRGSMREGTVIEVLRDYDADEEIEVIEVQLSFPEQEDSKQHGKGGDHFWSNTCDENCGAWNVFSNCLYASEPQ